MTQTEKKRRLKARLEGARQLAELLASHDRKCHWCGEAVTPFKEINRHWNPRVEGVGWLVYQRRGKTHRVRLATVDHVKPIWRGGTSSLKNLVLACGECNQLRSQIDSIREHEWSDLSQRRRFAEYCASAKNRMRQKLRLPGPPAPGSEAMEVWQLCESFKY